VRPEGAQTWAVKFGEDVTPAPDGEEYFAAALYMADRRWGSNSGEVNYREEAAKISWAMLHNRPHRDGGFPIINRQSNMVVFVPYQSSNDHSDPSYHLPGFYELFAEYGPSEDAERWRELARISREYLVKSAHPTTGLHPDYALFDGRPTQGYQSSKHDAFYYDAWRVPLNMALDHAWFRADPRLKVQVEKYHAFFSRHLGKDNVSAALFELDGSSPSGGGSTALTATLAAGALISGAANRKAFVQNLWGVSQQSGQYRYYQQCVYLLGLLATAGRFQYDWAAPEGGGVGAN
jgi:oligosaccharide reducing-end xylanase